MEQEHGLISSLLEWAGRRVDGTRTAEAVAEGLGGAQLPSVPFTSGSPQGDMEVSVSFFCLKHCVRVFEAFDNCLRGNFYPDPSNCFWHTFDLISLDKSFLLDLNLTCLHRTCNYFIINFLLGF
jgi:hypothetical protein